ncbi:MAG TPA: 3-hydroxyacyl-ACP dehydratase [Mucilaginibacter sp.]|jgi:predicted hotdog family 3-hydroxylacyl-ACP dehydratase
MTLPIENVLPLIPQKPPFVMVSKLLSVIENSARSSFLISTDNVFVKDNLFQEAGLMENMAQTAALGAGYLAKTENRPVALGYIGGVKDLEIFNLPSVNDELTTEITIENRILNVSVISGKVWHNEVLIAQCEMKLFTKTE